MPNWHFKPSLQQPLLYLAAPLIHRLHLHPQPVLLLPAALVVYQPDFLLSFHNLQIFAKFVSLFTLQNYKKWRKLRKNFLHFFYYLTLFSVDA